MAVLRKSSTAKWLSTADRLVGLFNFGGRLCSSSCPGDLPSLGKHLMCWKKEMPLAEASPTLQSQFTQGVVLCQVERLFHLLNHQVMVNTVVASTGITQNDHNESPVEWVIISKVPRKISLLRETGPRGSKTASMMNCIRCWKTTWSWERISRHSGQMVCSITRHIHYGGDHLDTWIPIPGENHQWVSTKSKNPQPEFPQMHHLIKRPTLNQQTMSLKTCTWTGMPTYSCWG